MAGAGTADNPIVYPDLVMPQTVTRTTVTIFSQGVALDADIYRSKNLADDALVPAVALSHGIGGDKKSAERYAAAFAEDGAIALCFSQAGWGESEGRLLADGPLGGADSDNKVTARVRMARETIDPFRWADGCRSALDYLEGEPNVDRDRLGLWGTSYGGGATASTAATDSRVKVLSVQVPALNPPSDFRRQKGAARAVQIARGEVSFVPEDDALPGLRGIPLFAQMARFNVAEQIDQITVPTLIIDAGEETMFDISTSGGAAYHRLKANGIDTYYEVIPGIEHYGIYLEGFERGCQLARAWFKKYL